MSRHSGAETKKMATAWLVSASGMANSPFWNEALGLLTREHAGHVWGERERVVSVGH